MTSVPVLNGRATSPTLIAMAALVGLGACEAKDIPSHVDPSAVRAAAATFDPTRYLSGGERVFFDDFERDELGPRWGIDRLPDEAEPPDWHIEAGWLRTQNTKNQGAWAEVIPEGPVRIEMVAKSLPPTNPRQRFAGDLKLEAFGTGPKHESGYSFINGGWSNQFDTIAKLGEHTADERRVAAKALEPDTAYRYAVVRLKDKVLFFRDDALLYTFDDPATLQGHWLGMNNWLSNAAIDSVAVFRLPQ